MCVAFIFRIVFMFFLVLYGILECSRREVHSTLVGATTVGLVLKLSPQKCAGTRALLTYIHVEVTTLFLPN